MEQNKTARIYDHFYFEEYARLSLSFIQTGWSDHFVVKDKPDLQGKDGKVGIEVTSADFQRDRMLHSFAAQFYGKKVSQDEIDSFWGEFLLTADGIVYGSSTTKGMISPSSILNRIQEVISAKNDKIDQYKSFDSMGLYIFTSGYVVEEDIPKLSSLRHERFDFIVLNCESAIILLDKGTTTFDMSGDALVFLKENAMSLSSELRKRSK